MLTFPWWCLNTARKGLLSLSSYEHYSGFRQQGKRLWPEVRSTCFCPALVFLPCTQPPSEGLMGPLLPSCPTSKPRHLCAPSLHPRSTSCQGSPRCHHVRLLSCLVCYFTPVPFFHFACVASNLPMSFETKWQVSRFYTFLSLTQHLAQMTGIIRWLRTAWACWLITSMFSKIKSRHHLPSRYCGLHIHAADTYKVSHS